MAVDILSWLENVAEESNAQWYYLESQKLDDALGWGNMLAQYPTQLQIQNPHLMGVQYLSGHGLLLTGPDGCGKHTAAVHMMKLLKDKGFSTVFLNSTFFDELSAQECIDRLETLLQGFLDKDESVCIQLDDLEDCASRPQLLAYFGRQLRNYACSDYPPLFLILIDREEKTVPALLRSRLQLFRMTLPDLPRRMAFLNHRFAKLASHISLEHIAQVTEGSSYSQLKDMICGLCCLMDSKNAVSLSDTEVSAFLAEQLPVPSLADPAQLTARSLQQLAEQMPQLLKALSEHTPAPSPIPNPIPNPVPNPTPEPLPNPDDYISRERKRLEKLPPMHLANELFGEDAVERLRKNREQLLPQ